jgi:hypothetical protein
METQSVASLSSLPGFEKAMASQRRIAHLEDSGYRTPIYADRDPNEILEAWMRVIEDGRVEPSILELERAEVKKFGPYFNRPYDSWKGAVMAYFEHSKLEDVTAGLPAELKEAMQQEIDLLRTYLPNGKVRALTIEEAYQRSNKNTNLGFPYVENHQTADQKVIDEYIRRAKMIVRGEVPHLYPFVLFKRVQPGGPEPDDAKNRPVWGADHAETYASLTLLYPLLDALSNTREFAHLRGIDELESVLKWDLPKWSYAISLDLSAADANFSPVLMSCGFQMISALVEDVDPRMIYTLFKHYTTGPILTPDKVVKGAHGMPSGVGLTNLIETLVFRVLARIYLADFNASRIFQNGDDGLYLTQSEPESNRLAEVFARYGCKVNVEKTSISTTHVSYLQRHFYPEYKYSAIMSTVRMLNRVLYAERGVDAKRMGMSPKDFWTLNTIMKLENCKRHPLFEEFVRFVQKGDKFGLEPSFIATADVNRIAGYSVFRVDSEEESDSSKSSGLLNFATVEVLLT